MKFSFGRFKVQFFCGEVWLFVDGHFYTFNRLTPALARFVALMYASTFGLIVPRPYMRGLRDCDSGGLVFAWHPVVVWNALHFRRLQAVDFGDGPDVWHRITWFEYLRIVISRQNKSRTF